jgi:hypothetical protein
MARESCLYHGPYARWRFPVRHYDLFTEGGPLEHLGDEIELWDTPLQWNHRNNFMLEVETDGVRQVHLCCVPNEPRPGRPARQLYMNWGIHAEKYVPDGLDLDLLSVDRPREIDWFRQAFRIELDEWHLRFGGLMPTFHWGLLVWYEP